MLLPFALLVAGSVALAFANGSNDVSKGIATLVGSGVSNFRTAVVWGTVWTVVGGIAAAFASQGLVATFSGKGFLDAPIAGSAFLGAVAVGAIGWIFLASKTGLPVSTTHSIAGALAGAGLLARGGANLHWSFLANKVAVPLALSPILSLVLVYLVFPPLARRIAKVEAYCVCLERRSLVVAEGAFALSTTMETAVLAPASECETSPSVSARLAVVDAFHWLSSALTSFARGLNDTPKIVALGITSSAVLGIGGAPFYLAVAAGMGAGSLLAGFRVTETLSRKVTRMSAREGLAANIVTTLLVGAASVAALPVSTTHVSSGAIVGIGLRRDVRSVEWGTVRDMALGWLITLPVSAALGALAFAFLRQS